MNQVTPPQVRRRPFFIAANAVVLLLCSAMLGISAVVFLVAPSSWEISYNDGLKPIGEIRFRAILFAASLSVAFAYFGKGHWYGDPKVRNVMFVSGAAGIVLIFFRTGDWLYLFAELYVGVFSFWYYYQKSNVKEFFDTYEQDKKQKT